MVRTVATIKLATTALTSVAGFMALPPYRGWAIASVLMLAVTLPALTTASARRLLAIAFFSIALYSFIIGQRFWRDGQLADNGLIWMLVLLPVFAFVLVKVYVDEHDIA